MKVYMLMRNKEPLAIGLSEGGKNLVQRVVKFLGLHEECSFKEFELSEPRCSVTMEISTNEKMAFIEGWVQHWRSLQSGDVIIAGADGIEKQSAAAAYEEWCKHSDLQRQQKS